MNLDARTLVELNHINRNVESKHDEPQEWIRVKKNRGCDHEPQLLWVAVGPIHTNSIGGCTAIASVMAVRIVSHALAGIGGGLGDAPKRVFEKTALRKHPAGPVKCDAVDVDRVRNLQIKRHMASSLREARRPEMLRTSRTPPRSLETRSSLARRPLPAN